MILLLDQGAARAEDGAIPNRQMSAMSDEKI
jgi:hypothetical protein